MTTRVIYLMLVSGLFLAGCGKERVMVFQGSVAVLLNTPDWSGSERVYSFAENASLATEIDTCRIPVYIIGRARTSADTFQYTVVLSGDHLRSVGYDGESALLHRAVLPGVSIDTLKLAVFRIQQMKDTTLQILLRIGEFNGGKNFPGQASYAGMVLHLDDLYRKPRYWDQNEDVFGPFSSAKMRIILAYYQKNYLTDDLQQFIDLNHEDGVAWALGEYLSSRLKQARSAGSPLLERDGSEMKAGILLQDNE